MIGVVESFFFNCLIQLNLEFLDQEGALSLDCEFTLCYIFGIILHKLLCY